MVEKKADGRREERCNLLQVGLVEYRRIKSIALYDLMYQCLTLLISI